ncbi:pentatricopeptide repeat-containing protein At4g17616 [Ricinus communis]|uniref:pentatricopeptide repeat-containing protein At4g17616 n=1 Tax=Ricinus communis TaxID=3988 RepID=UPI00201B0680|nr:pentatricopeptide repeat-containing protein At4g17616 [Ricinus communis]XP_048229371.1 pentatricopeptide repeat-containing protein At4g17616 [Ricinus communis]
MASAIRKTALVSYHGSRILVERSLRRLQVLDGFCKWHHFGNSQPFSTRTQPKRLCWEGSSHGVLLRKLEVSLKDHRLNEAWVTFNDFKTLYGFPKGYVVCRLLAELSYSSDPRWLQKACNLVSQIFKEKSDLLPTETLTKLSLSFARAQMPIPASMVLRVILERENTPAVSLLRLIVFHMVKTEVGTCLASNFLIQICECLLRISANRNDHAKVIKLDTLIFNLVLEGCVRFKSSLKGQELVEWMSRTGIIADAHSVVIIAEIYEMNGLRDEIKKFKDHIDQVSAPFVCHYQQLYEVLLNLHFEFDDLDAASELVLDMNRFRGLNPNKKPKNDQKPCLVSIGSQNLRAGLKIQILPEVLQKESVIRVEHGKGLLSSKNGKLLLSNRALANFIHGYKRQGRISELTKVLLSMQKDFQTIGESSLCSDVIGACACLGWLETAHDILDDMETAGSPCSLTTYMVLLTAYRSREMFKEADALVRQLRKAGLIKNLSVEMVAFTSLLERADNSSSSLSKSDLADFIIQETREEKEVTPTVHELNSSIYFFCKAKMMGDALKIYQKMQMKGIQPTVQTFAYLVYGYSSLGSYRDITIIWGDIKRNMKNRNFLVSRDLYELLLVNFLRGGYFERVMEVAGYMKECKMYTDKWMYKSEFLKLHKNLYKCLKASDTRNEVQRKRLEFVQTFRKWVGID